MHRRILLLFITFLCCCGFKGSEDSFKYVLDEAGVFSEAQFNTLDSMYRAHDQKTGNQLALITIQPPATNEDLHSYGVKLLRGYGIGKRETDNGLLILLCPDCKKVEIITGRGIQKVLPDAAIQSIVDNYIISKFMTAGYYPGILAGSKQIIAILERPENAIK